MNKVILLLIIIVAAGGIWYWYDNRGTFVVEEPAPTVQGSPEAVELTLETPDGTYNLDPASSSMSWQGSKPLLNNYFDRGAITVSEGSISVSGGQVTSGRVVVDMASLQAEHTGRGDAMANQLTGHLKSDAFFDVEQYPDSLFRLTGLQGRADGSYLVSGELTIKAATNPISFPATITAEDGRITLTATDVQVNRAQYDVRFGSGSFFDDLGDNLIDDIFTVSFTVVGVLDTSPETSTSPEPEN